MHNGQTPTIKPPTVPTLAVATPYTSFSLYILYKLIDY